MGQLKLFVLGQPRLERDGTPIELNLRKALALLVYLAVSGQSYSRDALATLLWPESDGREGRARLRHTLHRLNEAIGDHILDSRPEAIRLHPSAELWLDCAAFRQHVAAGLPASADVLAPERLAEMQAAIELYADDFLAGFTLPDSPSFDEWQFFRRESLRQLYGQVLEQLVQAYRHQQAWHEAISYARRWLALDPLHEPAHRALMRLYAWAGQQSAALRQYQECMRLLQVELGTEPEEETTELYEAIRTRQLAPPEATDRKPGPTSELSETEPSKRYVPEERLAEGGQGEVYRGRDRLTGQAVAIKWLKSELADRHPELVARFVREGAVLRRLNHPNIVGILDTFEHAGRYAIVMEYVPGGSLRALLDTARQLPLEQVLAIGLELADALSRAHHLGIIHRDLKPENVLLAADGTPRLTDFGLARLAWDDARLTQSGMLFGSPAYMSPEAVRGEELDAHSDIWSLGVLLYELLAGRSPFEGVQITPVLAAIQADPVPDLREFRPDVPPLLVELLGRMLVKERAERISSMRQVAAALEAIRDGRAAEGILTEQRGQARAGEGPVPVADTQSSGGQAAAQQLMDAELNPAVTLGARTQPGSLRDDSRSVAAEGPLFVARDQATPPGEVVSPQGGDDSTQVGTSARTTRTVGRDAELRRLHEHLEHGLAGTRQMPGTITALIGREAEAAVVGQLLRRQDVRLLTLTGPGGVGKTRLALEVATANQQRFADGIAFVALAPLADAALVLPTVARTLGLREAPGHSVTEALITYLQDKRMLLLLDNFEHVLEAVPQVAELLSSCPQLVVLSTSRAPLRLRGEQEYAVGPLALPDPKRLPPLEHLGAIASVQLFMQRARQVNPAFDLTPDTAPTVAAIVRRLDGLPLALELAAARIKLLSPTTLLARLDQALLLLVGGARDLPERQQTIRRTIDWSYDLLQPEEQTLFRMLAVFAGGWNLEAAEALGGAAGDVIDLLGRLVDQSMVVAFDAGIELRYRMLEPVREYALARLAEQGEIDAVKQRHALLYLSLAERAHPELRTNGQVEWMRRLDLELDNLRAAMSWFLEHGAAEEAARISFALWLFWYGGGYGREGRHYTDAIHAITRQLPPSKRYMSEIAALAMAYNNGDDEATLYYGRLLMESSRQMGRHAHAESFAQAGFGLVALNRGDLETATVHLEQALALYIEADEQGLAAQTYTWLGTVQMLEGDTEGAQQQLERSLSLARQIGHLYGIYNALFNLAQLALALGDFNLARERFRESMEASEQTGDWANVAYCLDGLATVIGVVGEAEQAVRVLGWAEDLRDSIGVPVWSFYKPDQSLYQQTLKRLREQLGDEAFQRIWAEGRRMTWGQIKATIL